MAENVEQELKRIQVGFRIQPSAHQRRTQERDEYEHFWGEDDSDDEWGELDENVEPTFSSRSNIS